MQKESIYIVLLAIAVICPFLGNGVKRLGVSLERSLKQNDRRQVWLFMTNMVLAITLVVGWLLQFQLPNLIGLGVLSPVYGYLATVGAMGFKSGESAKRRGRER